jgi:hypothetical protein
MTEDNVVHLPTRLEQLAAALRVYLRADAENHDEWLEIQQNICLTLAEARDTFTADIPFGKWCKDNGFGEDVLDRDTRAAAIDMGHDLEALCECLNATDRRSLLTIYRLEFPRFRNVSKPTRRKQTPLPLIQSTEQFQKACAAIDTLRARGEPVTYQAVRDIAGIGGTALRRALAYKEAEALLNPLTPADMRATERKRFDIAVNKARAELREELKAEVYKELDVFVRHASEQAERANQIIASHNGIMSREAFRKIKACLHPDHNTFAHAAEALQVFSELEPVLVKPDEPVFSGPRLPTTAAELMARRRTRAH